MPGHAGYKENENTDVGIRRAMDRAGLLNAINEAEQNKDVGNECESASLIRLQKCQVKRWLGRWALLRQPEMTGEATRSGCSQSLHFERDFEEEI